MSDKLDLQHETEFLVSQVLAIAPSISKAIPRILQAIGENFSWRVGNFWKIDTTLQKIFCDQMWCSPLIEAPKFFELNQKSFFSSGVELPGEVWKSGKPRWVTDLATLSHFPRATCAVKSGLVSAVVFPILLDEKLLGVMEFFSEKIRELDQNFLKMLDAICSQVGQFMEKKGAEDQLRISYEDMERRVQERTIELIKSNLALKAEISERKKVEKEILEIAQKEQRRFGSQLHDGLCQELTGILMFAKSLTQKMEKDNSLEIAELKKISDMLLDASDQARDTARGLCPGEMEGTSLMHSLQELVIRSQSLSGISCRFHCPQGILINNNNVATHLYRIAQEGVSNAIKHGKAQLIEVGFIKEDRDVVLIVKDDGVGFVQGAPQTKGKGIGLHIMKYRAHMMEASFQVEPNTPHGVILTCRLKEPSCIA